MQYRLELSRIALEKAMGQVDEENGLPASERRVVTGTVELGCCTVEDDRLLRCDARGVLRCKVCLKRLLRELGRFAKGKAVPRS